MQTVLHLLTIRLFAVVEDVPPYNPPQVLCMATTTATTTTAEVPPSWSPEEQKQLDAGLLCVYSTSSSSVLQHIPHPHTALKQYPATPQHSNPPILRYLRIAALLQTKTAKDVALRSKWTANNASTAKKRKAPSGATTPAAAPPPKHAKPRLAPPPKAAPPKPAPPPLDDHGAASVGVVSGPIATLLDSNYAILNQLKVNMQHCRVHENTELLMRYRDNILSILNHMNNMGGVMAQMPPLPVRMNVELANNFLPKVWGGGGLGGRSGKEGAHGRDTSTTKKRNKARGGVD